MCCLAAVSRSTKVALIDPAFISRYGAQALASWRSGYPEHRADEWLRSLEGRGYIQLVRITEGALGLWGFPRADLERLLLEFAPPGGWPWRIELPPAHDVAWVGYAEALALVRHAGDLDEGHARLWLGRCGLAPASVPTRFPPLLLAEREEASPGEHLRNREPTRICEAGPSSDDGVGPNVCLWFSTKVVLEDTAAFLPFSAFGVLRDSYEVDPRSGLAIEQVEWHAAALRAALADAAPLRQMGLRPPPVPFDTHPIACDKVARRLQMSTEGAAEWLRQSALSQRVAVRFSARYQVMSPPNLRLNGHPDNLTPQERATPYRVWFWPQDELRAGPGCMREVRITDSLQWHAAQLDAALARRIEQERAEQENSSGVTKARNKGGRPSAPEWWPVMIETGAWLAWNGEPATLAEVENYMAERLMAHGKADAGESTIRERARLALDTFKQWKAGN